MIQNYCDDLLEDITSLQNNPVARTAINQISYINLCVLKNELDGYKLNNNYPDSIQLPDYDLSGLNEHLLLDMKFKVLHTNRHEGILHLSSEAEKVINNA